MAGRIVSFWDGLFSGTMLVLGRVIDVIASISTNGKLVVWGPVVWNSWALMKGIGILGCTPKNPKPPTQTNNLPLVDWKTRDNNKETNTTLPKFNMVHLVGYLAKFMKKYFTQLDFPCNLAGEIKFLRYFLV